MHLLREIFKIDKDEALDFAASRGFGLLTAFDGRRPCGSHLPFVIRREDDRAIISTHVTAANPLAALASEGRSFLLAVIGPDAYVSNDWYITPDQVSTWLYEAVHLTGPARLVGSQGHRGHGDDLLTISEARLAPKNPWTLATMDARKRSTMLAGIKVIEIDVELIEGQRKINQHKPDEDHVSVANALEQSGKDGAKKIAGMMRALRPHLTYGD